ncbi:hypothetical protein ABMA77_05115 [Halobacteriovorax sp. RZ-1]|uniref:coiled-coil domain-containing protein n=1 Tax=unclassified Halobacteriovorax TaxID=2639665 RepID=UPI003713E334
MKVVKSSIILLFTINSSFANGQSGLISGVADQSGDMLGAAVGNAVVNASGQFNAVDPVQQVLVQQVYNIAETNNDFEKSIRLKRLQLRELEGGDGIRSKVPPMYYSASFLQTGLMSRIEDPMDDFSYDNLIELNYDDGDKSLKGLSNSPFTFKQKVQYPHSSAVAVGSNPWNNATAFRFDEAYRPCTGDDSISENRLGTNGEFLESFMFKLDSRFKGCSDDYLTIDEDPFSITPKVDPQKFCNCANKITHSDEQEEELGQKDVIDNFSDKIYEKVVAHRVKEFKDFLESARVRFDEFDKHSNVNDPYSCSGQNIENLSNKLKSCFAGRLGDAIDKKLELDSSDDMIGLHFMTTIPALGNSSRQSRAKNRLEQIFEDIDKNVSGQRQMFTTDEEKLKEFANIFILEYSQHKRGPLGFPRSYVARLNKYIYSDPVMYGAYQDFRKQELDVTDKTLRAKANLENKSYGWGSSFVDNMYISQVQEDMLMLQFATSISSQTLPRLLDGSSKASLSEISNALNALETKNDQGAKVMGDMYNVIRNQHEDELRATCRQKIEALEKDCNSSPKEIMSSLSLEEFVAINDTNSEDVSLNSRKYCLALDMGVTNENAAKLASSVVSDSQKVLEQIKGSYDPTTGLATNKVKSDDDSKLDGGLGGFVERANTAGDIINNGQDSGVANDGSSSEYNFDEAAQFLESYNSSNSAVANSSFTSSNVIDSNSLQSMIQNPTTSVKSLEDVRSRVEDEAEAIAKEIEENQSSTAVSTDEASQSAELKAELAALKAQIAELNSAITSKNESSDPTDDPEREKRIAAQRNKVMSNIAANSGFGGGRRDTSASGSPRAVQQASGGSNIPTNSGASGAGSISSAGSGVSGINRLGATGGLGLTSGSSSSRANSGAVAGDNIAKSDQRLVAKAIAEGSNSVVLADGRVYYIGHDEDGNVILSETAEEVLASVPGPEQEGPQLPTPKAEDGPKREIASEGEETKAPGEDSIYSKFLDAAEINE